MSTRKYLTIAVTAFLLASAAPVSADSLTLVWDTNPEPDVAGYIVHIGPEPGLYTSHIDVGDTTTYVLTTAVTGRRYCFAVSAYFPGPIESARSPEVCTSGDLKPTLANPGAQSHPLGAPLSVPSSATDPEGAPLTFSATGLPTGVSIAAATGLMSGTPTKTGTFAVRLKVSDGVFDAVQEFDWTIVSSVPQAPTLLRPAGATSTNPPVFEWQSVGTATRYRLWVDDASSVNPRLQLDLTPAELGCTATGSTCRHAPGAVMSAGAASWSVRASNPVGDGPWSGAMDFSVSDGRAPSVSIAAPTAAPTYSTAANALAIGGTANDDVAVTQVTWANDRGGAGTATGTTAWSVSAVPLKTGVNVITVTARDGQSNTATDVITVTRTDGDAPTVAIASPTASPSHSTTSSSIALAGTAADESGVTQVTWANSRGGSGTASKTTAGGTTGWFVVALALQPGENVITVTARDAAGLTGTARLTVTRTEADRVNPAVTITTPTSGRTHSTALATVALGGSATDDVEVTQVTWANSRGGSGTAAGTTPWTVAALPLQPGVNVVTVTAVDAAGNAGRATLSVTVTDTQRPTVSIAMPTADARYAATNPTVAVSGSARDDFGVATVAWSNDRGGSGIATGTTSWSVASLPLQAGVNVITVTARDAAGNTSTDTLAIALDARPPVVTIATPVAGRVFATSATSLSIAGTADDDGTIAEVVWSSDRGGSGRATGSGRWAVDRLSLRAGVNEITVTARDTAGNSSSARLRVAVTDTQAPTVRIQGPSAEDSFSTALRVVNIEGVATDDFEVKQVAWASDRGASGVARGTDRWIASGVPLQPGLNVIAVTAVDGAGQTASDVLRITVGRQPPAVSITSPSAERSFATNAPTVVLSGVASADAGITQVSWMSDRGPRGTASGTLQWTTRPVRLEPGPNVFTVSARAGDGNTATAILVVNYGDRVAAASTPATASSETQRPAAPATTTGTAGGISPSGTPNTQLDLAELARSPDQSALQASRPGRSADSPKAPAADEAGGSLRPRSLTIDGAQTAWTTSASTMALRGLASDNVVRVTWAADWGGSGTASGTRQWIIPTIGLQIGANRITVKAFDAAGGWTERVVTVTYLPRAKD